MKINAKVWSGRLDSKIRELARLSGKSRKEIVASSMDHFLRAAGKNTPQTKPKKRRVEESKNKRDWILWATPKTRLNVPDANYKEYRAKKYMMFVFRMRKTASKYLKIKYRGIGKMGWWSSLARLAFSSVTPRGFVSEINNKAGKYSSLTKSLNLTGKSMASARNAIDGISRYGEIASNKALRSTANWVGRKLKMLKGDMQKQFNR